MGISSSAGRGLALALFLTTVLAGCGSSSDTQAITALVVRFMSILAPANGMRSFPEDLTGIFTGHDQSETQSLLESMAPMSRDLSYTIRKVKFIPFGGASVSVTLSSEGSTSTLELKARKVGGEWKLDPSFHIRQRLDEVTAPRS